MRWPSGRPSPGAETVGTAVQSHYPERFERDMATTEAEWLQRLPGAMGPHTWRRQDRGVSVQIEGGTLHIDWHDLPARRIALLRLPRLGVRFVFEGVSEPARENFMRYFDLYMQRGGG